MVPYQAIFFDFDYTLGDATPSILQALPTAWTSSAGPPPTRMRSVGLLAILWRSPIPSSPGIVTRFTASSSAPISPKQLRPARGKKLSCCPAPQNCSAGWVRRASREPSSAPSGRTLCGAFWSTGVWQTSLRWYSAATMSPTVSRTPRGFCLLWNNWKSRPPRCYTVGTPFWTRRRPSGPDAIFRQSSTGPPQGRIFSPFPMSISLRTCQSYWIGLENRPDDPVGTAAWAGHSRPFCL